jgi:hypothetical protein
MSDQAAQEVLYKCPTCQAEIGREVQRHNKTMLNMGCVIVYRVHGYCPVCGMQIHWDARDVIYRRMMKRLEREG